MAGHSKWANVQHRKNRQDAKRGTGGLEGANYEEIRYEGYGIGGAAVMVDCMTDNKTRTVADVRSTFTKHGGHLGGEGSVAFLFKHCGQLVFAPGTNEDALMEAAIEAGAEDVIANDDGSIEVVTAPNDFVAVRSTLEKRPSVCARRARFHQGGFCNRRTCAGASTKSWNER